MNLIYAKKFRFPDNSANMIQGVNMVAAFYHCNTNTNAFFSFNDTIDDRNLFLKNYYGINFSAYSDRILFTSQKLRGLKYNLWLMKNIRKERLYFCILLIFFKGFLIPSCIFKMQKFSRFTGNIIIYFCFQKKNI